MDTASELALADIGAGQWGLVTTPQAVAAGIDKMQLSRLARVGRLARIARGVYALRSSMGEQHLDLAAAWLGLEPARLAHERLTDLPSGPVVSHASAAALHGLGDLDADRHEFTISTRKQTRRTDVRLHRGVLTQRDITRRDGFPVTTPTRTIADLLADHHDSAHVAGVLADAVRAHQVDLAEVGERIGSHAAQHGFGRGDGRTLVRHLLTVGGATEQADADELASIAREHQVAVGDLVRVGALAQHQFASVRAALAAAVEGTLDESTVAATEDVVRQLAMGNAPAARGAVDAIIRIPPVPDAAMRAIEDAVARLGPTPAKQDRGPTGRPVQVPAGTTERRHDTSAGTGSG